MKGRVACMREFLVQGCRVSRSILRRAAEAALGEERGIALFLVLWILMLLSVIAGEFCYTMRTEVNIARNFKESTQARYIAEAGLNHAVAELVRESMRPRARREAAEESTEEIPESEKEAPEDVEEIDWRINVDIPAVPFGEGEFKVRIENESGKININTADRALLEMALNGFDLDDKEKDVIADSILDWRDPDQLHRMNGAEDDYYESLPEPYECKDADFDSVEELFLVRGVTPEIFYGGLQEMFTAFQEGRASSERREGRGGGTASRINVNAASPEMLRSLPQMTDQFVQAIVEYRREKDFESLDELASVLDVEVYKAISPYITLKTSPYYTVTSLGKVGGKEGVTAGVQVMLRLDPREKTRFRLVRWLDRAEERSGT